MLAHRKLYREIALIFLSRVGHGVLDSAEAKFATNQLGPAWTGLDWSEGKNFASVLEQAARLFINSFKSVTGGVSSARSRLRLIK